MKSTIFILIFIFHFFDLMAQANCKKDLSFNFSISHHTGNEYLIGNVWEKIKDEYIKFDGWSNDGYCMPKKFDLNLELFNNFLTYDEVGKIKKYKISLSIIYIASDLYDGEILINPVYLDTVLIFKNRILTNNNFINKSGIINPFVMKEPNIDLLSAYKKARNIKKFIAQMIFNLDLETVEGEKCRVQYLLHIN